SLRLFNTSSSNTTVRILCVFPHKERSFRYVEQIEYSCSFLKPLALQRYIFPPQSAQNNNPENNPMSPSRFGRRRERRIFWTIKTTDSSITAGWVFSNIFHSLGSVYIKRFVL